MGDYSSRYVHFFIRESVNLVSVTLVSKSSELDQCYVLCVNNELCVLGILLMLTYHDLNT